MKQVNLGNRLSRWRMFLQGYDFTIVHTAGKVNVLADVLSRIYQKREAESSTDILTDPTISAYLSAPVNSPNLAHSSHTLLTLPPPTHMPSVQSAATLSDLFSLQISSFPHILLLRDINLCPIFAFNSMPSLLLKQKIFAS
jgi:hypothetical protein